MKLKKKKKKKNNNRQDSDAKIIAKWRKKTRKFE